ncbi:ABC transporter substrate-binding protein [Rubripirellula sp.]|nr:ABC transporter substrate-binding protein [Rubripirellula sp.]
MSRLNILFVCSKNQLMDDELVELIRSAVEPIVTQALCDVCAVAEQEVNEAACSLPGSPRVINLEPTCLQEVFDCITEVGAAVGIEDTAREVIAGLKARVDAVIQRAKKLPHRPRVMLLEWIDPPFSAGHWSPELVEIAGGREVIGVAGERSTTVSWDKIVEADPELLVIACCGFTPERAKQDLPILESYPGWSSLSCVRHDQLHFVDGSAYFSRPGPRLVDSLEILSDLMGRYSTTPT